MTVANRFDEPAGRHADLTAAAAFLRFFDPAPWMADAACRGLTGLFFLERGAADAYTAPREVCEGCPVRSQCLEHALANGEKFGLWGGHTESERRALRRSRRAS
jgi:WhiB family transcriptional regulator, redox-sensing transcriptional regulator